jgi:hypothetical protein
MAGIAPSLMKVKICLTQESEGFGLIFIGDVLLLEDDLS